MDVDMDVGAAHGAHEEVDARVAEEARAAGKPPSLAEKVSKAVWVLLEPKLPQDSPFRGSKHAPQLAVKGELLRSLKGSPKSLFALMKGNIWDVYHASGINYTVLRSLRDDLLAKVTGILNDVPIPLPIPRKVKPAEKAFACGYLGDADERFQRHLVRCCERYYENPADYTAPCVALTQSSGFGKSRILYELAKKLARPSQDPAGSGMLDMRLLYVCARKTVRSSGFPVATPKLTEFFFDTECMADRLTIALEYACANWEAVKHDWVRLFGVGFMNADTGVCEAAGSMGRDSVTSHCIVSGETFDAAVASALKAKKPGESGTREPSQKKSRSSIDPVNQDQRVKVLVLAIDSARFLLERSDDQQTDVFHRFRLALTEVNKKLFAKQHKVMIFAVLINDNPRIHDFVPPLSRDPSSRRNKTKVARLFPPFVLTHTMDVAMNRHRPLRDPPFDYKASVLQSDPDEAWETLVSMGRPLWHSYVTSETFDSMHGVLYMAGSKLLCGLEPTDGASYGAESLNGVASLLCRLGLRPQSSSALASQVVADFMAVLHYVSYTYEAHISGYLTEPILAFAATHLWYEITPSPLQEFILPQFQELVMQGVIDVGGIGEMVAHIVLLLAIDKTIMSAEPGRFALSGGKNYFKGQFCSVKRFLGLLDGSFKPSTDGEAAKAGDQAGGSGNAGPKLFNVTIKKKNNEMTGGSTGKKKAKRGANTRASATRAGDTGETNAERSKETVKTVIEVRDDASPEQKDSFKSWMNDWDDWSVGFSHFVELTAMPTKATLWFLLGRRAGGVFPRNQKGADLIIPIFHKSSGEVSFMLVQVKNKVSADSEFPQSALGELTPASVFHVNKKKHRRHELSEFSPRQMIRIFMSLRESNMNKPAQSYLIDKARATCAAEESYSLCLRGMCRLLTRGSKAPLAHWLFLHSQELSDQLARLADSAWWDPSARIKADLARRSEEATAASLKEDMPDKELEEGVAYTLRLVPKIKSGKEEDVEMKTAVEA